MCRLGCTPSWITSRRLVRHLDELRLQAQRSGSRQRRAAAFVVSHRAQENHAVSQPVGVHREVEGRSAEPYRVGKYVPQNFTNAEDCHLILKLPAYHSVRDRATPPVPYRSHKYFRLALTARFAYSDTVGRFVHADSSQSKK
jgi:hypothetical protein